MGLFRSRNKGHKGIDTQYRSNNSGSALPPISQYVASKPGYSESHETYGDYETRMNTSRNSQRSSTSAGLAAAAALKKSRDSQDYRTNSLSRIDEQPSRRNSYKKTALKNNTKRTNNIHQLSSYKNRNPDGRSHSMNGLTRSALQGSSNRSNSLTSLNRSSNLAAAGFVNGNSVDSRTNSLSSMSRKMSMTSLLSQGSGDIEDMSIQSTITKKGNVVIKQTKIIDAQGVTRKIITKTVKKVGNFEVVKHNTVNLAPEENADDINRIAELAALEELEDSDEELMLNESHVDHFKGFDENQAQEPLNEFHLDPQPKLTPKRGSSPTVTSPVPTPKNTPRARTNSEILSHEPLEKLVTNDSKTSDEEFTDAAGSLEKTASDSENGRSRSRVGFKGVQVIQHKPVARRLSDAEMYEAAFKAAQEKVFGKQPEIKTVVQKLSQSSFERSGGSAPMDNGRRYSLRGSPPKLGKKSSISSLRSLALTSPNKAQEANTNWRTSRKEKKYLKEKSKLDSMSLQDEIRKAQQRAAEPATEPAVEPVVSESVELDQEIEKPHKKKRFLFFRFKARP